ncbi:MAG: hypothetical protein P1P85_02980 [Patescibacteria group bacterium]|nr:hypothetical protein [Patescibacteria group bacterium]
MFIENFFRAALIARDCVYFLGGSFEELKTAGKKEQADFSAYLARDE